MRSQSLSSMLCILHALFLGKLHGSFDFGLSAVFGTNSPAATPQLKILVLNFKTNRPIAGHRVELLLPCILQGNWPHRIKRKKTTKDGISGFKLSTPLPTNVCV